MKTIKAKALVLREYEAAESDKRLLLLCKGHGRVMAYARGARKQTSKFMAAAQVFTYSEFVLAQGSGFYSVAQADVIESFYPLRQDYDRLMAACDILETCEKTLWDNVDSDELLLLALRALKNLSKGMLPPQVKSVFLFRFFMFHGVQPQLDGCMVCNEAANFLHAEGLACEEHRSLQGLKISEACLAAMRFIQESDLSQSFMFNASEAVLNELEKAAELLWRTHFSS